MTARNDITGDLITTKQPTDAYRNNFDAIFGKKKKEEEKKYRYFTHEAGFADDTRYIRIPLDPKEKSAVVRHDGSELLGYTYDLETSLRFVAKGSWIEIEKP